MLYDVGGGSSKEMVGKVGFGVAFVCRNGIPTHLCTQGQAVKGAVGQRLAEVVPAGVDDTEGSVFVAIAAEVGDVGLELVMLRPHPFGEAHTRGNKEIAS